MRTIIIELDESHGPIGIHSETRISPVTPGHDDRVEQVTDIIEKHMDEAVNEIRSEIGTGP